MLERPLRRRSLPAVLRILISAILPRAGTRRPDGTVPGVVFRHYL